MTDAELVGGCIWMDREQKQGRETLNRYKAELQKRGSQLMEDKNTKYAKFYGDSGSVAVMDSMSLDILNPDKLKEFIGEGVYRTKIKENVKTDYKCDPKLEKALKAIFTGDYTFEMPLKEFLDEMSVKPDTAQKTLLLKKLKGEYEKDRETLAAAFGQEHDFEVELWYIYKIKNAELIRAFLPEEGLDGTIEGIRKSILVESKTAITLNYEAEKEEEQ